MMYCFVLRPLDETTGCFVDSYLFEVLDINPILKLLHIHSFEEGRSFEIGKSETAELAKIASIDFDQSFHTYEFFRIGSKDQYNPNSHTGRELLLMLQGKKPLAAFVDDSGGEACDIIPEAYFAPFVLSNSLRKFEYERISHDGRRIRTVLYSLPNETWRFEAHRMLWILAEKHGWNSGFEMIEGFLLGYEVEVDPFFTLNNSE